MATEGAPATQAPMGTGGAAPNTNPTEGAPATQAPNGTLVDANVLIDVMSEDGTWFAWSMDALAAAAENGPLYINPIIYAEVSVRFSRIEDLDDALPADSYRRLPLPWAASFLAGKAFLDYRRNRGLASSTLPDFFIGAHAAVASLSLLTRDAARYRTYFPTVRLIAPQN